jgi:hypothetical protein
MLCGRTCRCDLEGARVILPIRVAANGSIWLISNARPVRRHSKCRVYVGVLTQAGSGDGAAGYPALGSRRAMAAEVSIQPWSRASLG